MILHVLMFKMRDPSPEHLAECKARLDSLPPKIPEIKSYDVGIDVLHSGRSWDLVLVSTFDDLDALRAYQVNADHEAVAAFLRSGAEASASVDAEI
ncbi:MAG TPA: Dabb family protein [Acidimicrobiales bacterium]|nr:Dabb family protein [Acidimicrobiales bacterium]